MFSPQKKTYYTTFENKEISEYKSYSYIAFKYDGIFKSASNDNEDIHRKRTAANLVFHMLKHKERADIDIELLALQMNLPTHTLRKFMTEVEIRKAYYYEQERDQGKLLMALYHDHKDDCMRIGAYKELYNQLVIFELVSSTLTQQELLNITEQIRGVSLSNKKYSKQRQSKGLRRLYRSTEAELDKPTIRRLYYAKNMGLKHYLAMLHQLGFTYNVAHAPTDVETTEAIYKKMPQ